MILNVASIKFQFLSLMQVNIESTTTNSLLYNLTGLWTSDHTYIQTQTWFYMDTYLFLHHKLQYMFLKNIIAPPKKRKSQIIIWSSLCIAPFFYTVKVQSMTIYSIQSCELHRETKNDHIPVCQNYVFPGV